MVNKHKGPSKKAHFTSALFKSRKLTWQEVSKQAALPSPSGHTINFEHQISRLEARVATLEQSFSELVAKYGANPYGLLTIVEFCRRVRMKRTTYFALKKARQGPRETKIGGKIFITVQAESDWLKSNEVPSGTRKPTGNW